MGTSLYRRHETPFRVEVCALVDMPGNRRWVISSL